MVGVQVYQLLAMSTTLTCKLKSSICRRVHTDPACSGVITSMPTALARHLSDQVAESDGQAPGTFLYKLRLAACGVIVRVLN